MKKLNQIVGLFVIAAMGLCVARSQDFFSSLDLSGLADNGVLELSGTNISSFQTFSDDELTALVDVLDATPTISASDLPTNRWGNIISGTYWSLQQPGMPPLPGDIIGADVWPMADGSFLLDDIGAGSAGPMGMHAMDDGSPLFPGGGGTNYYTPTNSYVLPDYGTNLWIEITNVGSGYVSGLVSNTTGNMQIEIQYTTDLARMPWQSAAWYVYGSQLTNWTAWVEPAISSSNLFLRAVAYTDDGSGLPISWQLEYFGTTGVNPNGDAEGDGWSNIQKFNNGMNPNAFYTPPAPAGFTAIYDQNNGAVNLNWLPAPGNVTGYVLVKYDGQADDITTNYISSSAVNYADSIAGETTVDWPILYVEYSLQAKYGTNGVTSQTWAEIEDANAPLATTLTGSQGLLTLVIPNLPNDLSYLQVSRQQFLGENIDYGAADDAYATEDPIYAIYESVSEASYDIPASSITNGICQISATQVPSFFENALWVQTVRSNGVASGWTQLDTDYGYAANTPFVDARQQLKDNLRFLLRAAGENSPYAFIVNEGGEDWYLPSVFAWPLDNYIYAGFYGEGGNYDDGNFDEMQPIDANCFYRNFVFDENNLNTNGLLNTSISGGYTYEIGGALTAPCLEISNYPAYYFNLAGYLTNSATIPSSQITSSEAQWLLPNDGGVQPISGGTIPTKNFYGLTNLSVQCAYINTNGQPVLQEYSPSQTLPSGVEGVEYFQTAQPVFTNIGYYFARVGQDKLPEQTAFAVTNATPQIFVGVGSSQQIAGYAKLGIQNGFSDFFAYLGQYFTNAYEIDTNGNPTSTTTGILSPYGDFFATASGPTALITMPDIDTGEQGTCTVYCVSLNVDRNHNGYMDLTFNGTDGTSTASPDQIWANNNYDRFTLDADDQIEYDDDVQIGGDYFTQNTPVPDYNFKDGAGHRVIPCARDLQDFFRLWVCGIDTNLIAKLPAGSTITLNWGDVGSPNTGNPTIDIFAAADPDGGIGYLTNSLTAEIQTDPVICPYIGRLGPGQSIQLNAIQFANGWAGNHFIMCGVSNGTGGLNLTIADASGNVLAQSTSYLQIVDIKQMYERWTIGDMPSIALTTNAVPATEDLPIGASAFQYTQPQDTNTPYILYVHGWNMERWEKDRFAESAFKRLYWQGYHGRFGSFRWPTENGFKGISSLATDPSEKDNFDRSEYTAWQSSVGLLNKLKDLNAEYPGHVYMLAHSMGNIVAGEALRLATQQGLGHLVNTYVASQAAVSAHTYDTNIANYSFNYFPWRSQAVTPNIYGNWFLGNNGGGAGQVVNFYNTNDYALQRSVWQLNQLLKPDQFVLLGGTHWDYSYVGVTNDPPPWNHFQKDASLQIWNEVNFDIVNVLTNRYEVMGLAAESYTTALGATPGVHNVADSIYLGRSTSRIWPVDTTGNNYAAHFWHSAEFRGDYWQQQGYWSELLGSDAFNLK